MRARGLTTAQGPDVPRAYITVRPMLPLAYLDNGGTLKY